MSNLIVVPQFSVPSKVTLTNDEYHLHPAIGSSSLKPMLKSPAHYKAYIDKPRAPTKAMDLGTAIHQAILEPNRFESEAVVMPKFEGTGSRAAKEEWLLENHGKLILSLADLETIDGILGSIRKNKLVSKLLSSGAAEESYFWQDPDTGLVCKCRPDFLREGHIIVDVKSTVDASFDGFPTQVARMKYHLSAAMYLDGVSAVLGQNFDQFIVLAIEKEPPYALNVHLLDQGTIDAGRLLYKRALKQLKECREKNSYPGYTEKVLTLSLPNWAFPFEEVD